MPLLENPRAVAERLIAELSDGQRTPQDAVSGLHDLESWDLDSLEQLLQELRDSSRAGRLSDHDFGALCLILKGWLRSTPDRDPDATDELDAQPLPAAPPPNAHVATASVELGQGSILRDRYVLGEPAARGGMSIVFRARDLRRDAGTGDSSEIAVKVLRNDLRASASANARLRREFRQTQALRHAGAVRMFDLDCDHDVWFITMELLEGMSLETWLKRAPAQPLELADVMRIASACADVLACAHQQGTAHGDFKPGNVFLEDSGAVKVLDFGAAPEARPSPVEAAADSGLISPVASRAYASPEVLAGQPAEPRDDVFSFTCVVYELFCGRHPFGRLPANEARDASLVAMPLAQLSPGQNAAVARGLAWTRAERPSTVRDLMLSLLNGGGTVSAEPVALRGRSPSPFYRRRWRWLGALVAAVLLIAIWRLRVVDDHDRGGRAVNSAPAVPESATGVTAPVTAPVVQKPAQVTGSTAKKPATPSGTAAPSTPHLPLATPPTRVPARDRARVSADSASIVVSESAPAAVILLRRQGDLSAPAQITWRLSNGTARAREDFGGPTTGTTRFLPGQTTRALYIPLINDTVREGDESFSLRLSSRSAAIGPIGKVTITIVDDDR